MTEYVWIPLKEARKRLHKGETLYYSFYSSFDESPNKMIPDRTVTKISNASLEHTFLDDLYVVKVAYRLYFNEGEDFYFVEENDMSLTETEEKTYKQLLALTDKDHD